MADRGRPTSRLRLRDLDPEALAREVTDAVLAHVLRLVDLTEPGRGSVPRLDRDLSRSVRCLAAYARDGTPLDAPVGEYLVSMIPLYTSPMGESEIADLSSEVDPETPLGLVLVAAIARDRIATGVEMVIHARELAVLAGLDVEHVRRLCRSGEIEQDAAGARRWLAARGVPGF